MVALERELILQSKQITCRSSYKAACALSGRNRVSAAHMNKETADYRHPCIQAARSIVIKPTAYGPTNPPSFAIEVIRAMPDAAENPVRNSPGKAKKTGNRLNVPNAAI